MLRGMEHSSETGTVVAGERICRAGLVVLVVVGGAVVDEPCGAVVVVAVVLVPACADNARLVLP